MAWFWQSDKPAEELVEKIDEVMEPYRKTPAPDAAKKRDEWEESVLAKARKDKALREGVDKALANFAKELEAAGMHVSSECDNMSIFFHRSDYRAVERLYGHYTSMEPRPRAHGFSLFYR